jgi:hypothetical protein
MSDLNYPEFKEYVVEHPVTMNGVTIYPRVDYDILRRVTVVVLYLPGEIILEVKPAELKTMEESINWYRSLFNVVEDE